MPRRSHRLLLRESLVPVSKLPKDFSGRPLDARRLELLQLYSEMEIMNNEESSGQIGIMLRNDPRRQQIWSRIMAIQIALAKERKR